MSADRRRFLQAGLVGGLAWLATGVRADEPAKTAPAQAAALYRPTAGAPDPATMPESELGKTPHTRFAVNIEMWWKKLPFLDRVKQVAALGFPAYEFWPFEQQLDKVDSLRKLNDELKVAAAQFTVWGFKPGLNEAKNHDAFLKKIEAGCQFAKQLDCKLMTVVAGNDVPGMTQEQMHEQVISALRRAVPICAEHKITMILESMNIRVDHPGHCLYGSPAAIKIIRAVDSEWCKINWDLYHMHISEGDLSGRMREGIKEIGYLQLADHPGRNEPGTGEIYYPRVLRQAYELGYRGFVGLELNPKTTELAAAQAAHRADQW